MIDQDTLADDDGRKWQCLLLSRVGWQGSVPVCFGHPGHAAEPLWELRQFFYQLLPEKEKIHSWLDTSGKHRKNGHAHVERFIEAANAGALATCEWFPSSKADPASCFQEHMCSTGWLLCWLLHFFFKKQEHNASLKRLPVCSSLLCMFAEIAWPASSRPRDASSTIFTPLGHVAIGTMGAIRLPAAVSQQCGFEQPCMLPAWLAAVAHHRCFPESVRSVIPALIAEWSSKLAAWVHQEQAESNLMHTLATHPRGPHRARRATRLVLSRLSAANSVAGTTKAWQDMGSQVAVSNETLLEKGAALHLNYLHEAFSMAETVEMVFDASRYGKYNHELYICQSPEAVCPKPLRSQGSELGLSCFLPPIPLQELLWRDAKPSAPLTAKEMERLCEKGMRSDPGASTKHMFRVLNHQLRWLGLTLASFQSRQHFRHLPAGWVRYWCQRRLCWIRASDCCDGEEMELVEAWFRQRVKILLLTLDQAGPGWSMCHFLVAPPQHGMNLMLDFENDFFHRSPNDFNWARDQAEGGHRLTAIQMIHVFNANFGPYLTGARMLQKQEFLAVIRQWKPIPDDEVCQHARDMAAGAIPATQEDMDHLYEEQILNNLNFVSQGPFCRMKGWYTFVACMARYDPQWHGWKQLLRWLGQFVSQQGGKAGHALRKHVNTELSRLVSEAPQNDDGPPGQRSADAMKEGIAKLKKTSGQAVIMSPALMHNLNLFNMRVQLLVGRPLWTEFNTLASEKTTRGRHAKWAIQQASGQGEAFLRQIWRKALFNAREFERLGFPVTSDARPAFVGAEADPSTGLPSPGVTVESIPSRLTSFLLYVMTARGWSIAEYQWRWPKRFGLLLSPAPGEAQEAYRMHETWWSQCLDSEGLANEKPGIFRLRQEAYWQDWPLVQYVFRLLAHYHFHPHPEVVREIQRLYDKIGDSRSVEEGHKLAKDRVRRDRARDDVCAPRVFQQLWRNSMGNPLVKRGMNTLLLPDDAWSQAPAKKLKLGDGVTLPSVFDPHSTKLDPSWPVDNMLGIRKTYVSKSPAGSRPSISAAAAHTCFWKDLKLDAASRAMQASILQMHSLVREKVGGTPYLVIMASTFAARVWRADERDGFFRIDPSISWEWVIVPDMAVWEFIPHKWAAHLEETHKYGFLAMQQTSLCVPAVAAALVRLQPRAQRLPDAIRAELCDLEGIARGPLRQRERNLLDKVLADTQGEERERLLAMLAEEHRRLENAARARADKKRAKQAQCQDGHRSDEECQSSEGAKSEASDVPPEMAELTSLCLDEMDPLEQRDCLPEKRRFCARAPPSQVGQGQQRRSEAQLVPSGGGATSACRVPATEPVAAASGSGTQGPLVGCVKPANAVAVAGGKCLASPDGRGQASSCAPHLQKSQWKTSKVEWVRPLLPWYGMNRPPSVTKLTCNRVLAKCVWSVRFEDTRQAVAGPMAKETKSHNPCWGKCSRTKQGACNTEHQCFQQALTWLWARAAKWHDLPQPAFVQDVLRTCEHCVVGAPCSWPSSLINAGQSPVASPVAANISPRASSESSSASSSSTSTSSSPPGSLAGSPPMCWCCGDEHDESDCPFVRFAVRASLTCQQQCRALGWQFDAGVVAGVRVSDVARDGNCLYHALGREFAFQLPAGFTILGRLPPPSSEARPGMFWRAVLCDSVQQQQHEQWVDGQTVAEWVHSVTGDTVEAYVSQHGQDGEYGGFFEAALLARAMGPGWEIVLVNKRDGSSRIVAIVGARSEGSGSVIGAAWEGNHWQRARFTQKGLQEVRAWKKKNQHAALPDQSK